MFDFFVVIGGLFSTLAWAILVIVPIRRTCGLRNTITEKHLNLGGIALLATSLIVSSGYLLEIWMAWYSHSRELEDTIHRMWHSTYFWSYWILIATNSIVPMLLWIRCVRCNDVLLFLIALTIQIGIWIERITIILALS